MSFQIEEPDSENNNINSYFGNDPSNDEDNNLIDVYEPLLPADGNTIQLLLAAGGNVETYAYQWFSANKYPNKTVVHYQGMTLVVNKIDPYEDAGLYIYYLNDRSDHN